MNDRIIENPVTGERATFIETSSESAGARSIIDIEVSPGGGVPTHRHTDHEERIEVLEGEIEVTMEGVAHRAGAGECVLIERGTVHSWRNPSPTRKLRFRGAMTPGNPGFEGCLRLLFGLGRDGELRKSGLPRRFADVALLAHLDPSLLSGALALLAPIMRWTVRRTSTRQRASALLNRYGCSDLAIQ